MVRQASLLLFVLLLLVAAGCGRPAEPEPQTNAEIAARGKMMRAISQFSAGSFKEDPTLLLQSVSALNEALAYDPAYHRANAMMALVVLELCRYTNVLGESVSGMDLTPESARPFAMKALSSDAKSVEGWSALAMVCLAESDFDGAKLNISKARSANSSAKEYLLAWGDYLFNVPEDRPKKRADNIVDAAAAYSRAIDADSQFGVAYTRLLDVYEAVGDNVSIAKLVIEIRSLGFPLSPTRTLRYRQRGIL